MHEEVYQRLPCNSPRPSQPGVVLVPHKHKAFIVVKSGILADKTTPTHACRCAHIHTDERIHTNRHISHTGTDIPRHTGAKTLHASMHRCTPNPFPLTSLCLIGIHCIYFHFKRQFSGCQIGFEPRTEYISTLGAVMIRYGFIIITTGATRVHFILLIKYNVCYKLCACLKIIHLFVLGWPECIVGCFGDVEETGELRGYSQWHGQEN